MSHLTHGYGYGCPELRSILSFKPKERIEETTKPVTAAVAATSATASTTGGRTDGTATGDK